MKNQSILGIVFASCAHREAQTQTSQTTSSPGYRKYGPFFHGKKGRIRDSGRGSDPA